MSDVDFRAREFGNGEGNTAVALVAGFDGRIEHFEQAARDLVRTGNDVVAYEYDNDIFLAGDGTLMPRLAKNLSADFLDRSKDHSGRRYAGASLGGGLGWNMQRDCPDAQPGLYAAAGANAAHLVMNNMIFRGIVKAVHKIDPAKEFKRNGYTEDDLWSEWRDLHTPPSTGFAVALGGIDFVVKQREVMPKYGQWQKDIDIRVLVKRRLGHTGIIKWFNDNIPAMLELTETVRS